MPCLLGIGRRKARTSDVKTPKPDLSAESDRDSQGHDARGDDIQIAPWKALFFFTTRQHLVPLTLGVFCAVVAGVSSPAQSVLLGKAFGLFTKYAAGKISGHDLMKQEMRYVYYMLAIGVGSWLVHFFFFALWLAFGELQAKSARDRLFQGLLEKEIAWYDVRKSGIGALIPRLQAQIRELQLATSQPLGGLITTVATACFSFGLAMFYSWKLTLVIISTIPLMIFILSCFGKAMQPNLKEYLEKLTEALTVITSALTAIETVKSFNGQWYESSKYYQKLAEATGWYIRIVNINATQSAFTQFFTSAMFVQAFYYGGTLVNSGEKNAGDVVTTFMSALGAFGSVSSILGQLLIMEKGRTAGATLRAVMTQVDRAHSERRQDRMEELVYCQESITIDKVSFSYPTRPDRMALKDVNMSIPGGELSFIIGKSGSGKSTLGQLLMRFYLPGSGEILLGDMPISRVDTTTLRENITLVEQNSILFMDTVENNVALGGQVPGAIARAKVQRAVEFALLQLTVNDMPEGLETFIGSRGDTMSGGQRQRMALARAWMRDTPILVLDESTSALDYVSRTLMLDAIKKWRLGKTTVIVTHDIAQILPDDYAFVFENGSMVQEGYRKHLERIKHSPFQDFLSADEKAQLLPFDSRRHTPAEWAVRLNSEAMLHPNTGHNTTDFDPIEVQLTAGETKRMSFLPNVLADSNGKFVLQNPYATRGHIGTYGSPLMNFAAVTSSPPTDHWSESGKVEAEKKAQAEAQKELNRKRTAKLANRWSVQQGSELMDKFVNKTGSMAAQVRRDTTHVRQRQTLTTPDPHKGPFTTTEEHSSGLIRRVELADYDNHIKVLSLRSILHTIWPNIDWFARTLLILAFIACIIHAAATPVFSFVLEKLIETYGTGAKGKHKSLVYALSILGIAFVDSTCVYASHILLEFVGQTWINRIRQSAVEHILDQPRDFFAHEENAVSHLTESLDRHAEEMRNLLGRFLSLIIMAAVMISISLIWALVTSWKLTLIALSVGPYVYAVTKAFSAVSGKWEGLSNDASERASAIFTETFTSIKTVRALTLEAHFSAKYHAATNAALRVGFQRALYAGFFFGLSDSSGTFVQALVFYAGAKLASTGTPVAHILLVFLMLIMTITNISGILSYIPQMSAARDTASRILRLAQLPQSSHEHEGNTRIASIGDIVFNGLSFAYPSRPQQMVLRDLHLTIPRGVCTALVGASGSGKSTIAALLLNLYPTTPATATGPDARSKPPSKAVLSTPVLTLSGRDIRHIHTPTLRSLIAIVAQTPTLFPGTVAENIAYGIAPSAPLATLSSVREAAAAAGIDDFVMSLPQGYSTLLGEGGMGLSGGQAQRVAIARALVRRPAVLVLDEATSALDVESAGLIRETVGRLVRGAAAGGRGMTVVIITHSRDMMAIAENVVVLDQGRVVEQGGFEELVAKRGALFRLLNGGEWVADMEQEDEVDEVQMRGVREVDWAGRSPGRNKGKGRAF